MHSEHGVYWLYHSDSNEEDVLILRVAFFLIKLINNFYLIMFCASCLRISAY